MLNHLFDGIINHLSSSATTGGRTAGELLVLGKSPSFNQNGDLILQGGEDCLLRFSGMYLALVTFGE